MDSDDMDWRGTGRTTAAKVPVTKPAPAPIVEENRPILSFSKPEDKWDGEDENGDSDNVKDNWDDEDEEVLPPPTTAESALAATTGGIKAIQIKSKKGKKKNYEEKQVKADDELTPIQIEEKKLREEKAREAEELRLTQEAFGISAEKNELLDTVNPITKDDFDGLRKKIIEDLGKFSKRSAYQDFVEELIQDLAICLPSKRLKKVKTIVEALYFEKSKAEKVKPTASKGAKLNVEGDRAILKETHMEYDDYEDFM